VTTKKQTKQARPMHKKIREHTKHFLVPHKGNQYRPHLIRWPGLTAVVVIALFVQVGYGFITTGKFEVLGRTSDVTVAGLLKETNQARQTAGLGELILNDKLNAAAYAKAKDMFANNYWAHDSPSGIKPWRWLSNVDYNYDQAGENLAKNYLNSTATVDAWLASSTHRANVLNENYADVGFAVVDDTLNGKETTVVVAYYAKPTATGAVMSANDTKTINAPVASTSSSNPLVYFGTVIQSLSPATLGVFGLLIIVMVVSMVAHHYRFKLPKRFQKTWKLHHGLYKAAGSGLIIVLIIVSTTVGQV